MSRTIPPPATEEEYTIIAYRVKMVREREISKTAPIEGASGVAKIARDFIPDDGREHFCVALLDSPLHIIGINEVSIGHMGGAIAHPRELFIPAILAKASAMILFHNHPSGNLEPSTDDIQLTIRAMQAGDILQIKVLDHVIVSHTGEHYSLAANEDIFP